MSNINLKENVPDRRVGSCAFVNIQRIQVECLTVSVVAFVVTVELIALRGKMTDVARQE